jgi:predicted  nucleic acid-binding Zn-ribbon protein
VSEVGTLLQLHDLDLLLSEVRDGRSRARLRKLGFEIHEPTPLERARERLLAAIDRRWLNHYERAVRRYGRAMTVVRDRVCQGCFITLPTSISPGTDKSLTLCESCGRILYWP